MFFVTPYFLQLAALGSLIGGLIGVYLENYKKSTQTFLFRQMGTDPCVVLVHNST